MSAPLELSLVIPVYNERDNLPVLVEEIGRALAGRAGGEPYEIVAVDDGSTDGSLDVLKALKREHPEIHIVAFAANAGQTAAFAAGFGAARGRVIVTLDADLQNDPADVPVLVAELERSGAAAVAVDAGSTDGSLDGLKALKREHPEIHIVAFAANAGQTAAFAAGFGAARGRVIVTLDADLQNDPADVPVLVAELERSGAAAVVGYRVDRRDSGW